jgi:hypothetical protein
MAVKSLNYLDIPERKRRQVAAQETLKLKNALTNPALTPEQVQKIMDRIEHLNRWGSGRLE